MLEGSCTIPALPGVHSGMWCGTGLTALGFDIMGTTGLLLPFSNVALLCFSLYSKFAYLKFLHVPVNFIVAGVDCTFIVHCIKICQREFLLHKHATSFYSARDKQHFPLRRETTGKLKTY